MELLGVVAIGAFAIFAGILIYNHDGEAEKEYYTQKYMLERRMEADCHNNLATLPALELQRVKTLAELRGEKLCDF